jgi:hypothetical protein
VKPVRDEAATVKKTIKRRAGWFGRKYSDNQAEVPDNREYRAKKSAGDAARQAVGSLGKGKAAGADEASKQIYVLREQAREVAQRIPAKVEALDSPRSTAVAAVLIEGLLDMARLTNRDEGEAELVGLGRIITRVLRDR